MMSTTEVRIGSRVLQLSTGDIANQPDLDAVVNAANAELMPGGGVAGAIHRAAGPELAGAGRPLAPIQPGDAVATPAFNLPNEHVIHVLGPVYGRDVPSDEILAKGYGRALELAEELGTRSIGFPAVSTGIFGYPVAEAAQITLATCIRFFEDSASSVELIRFVLFSDSDYQAHSRALHDLHPRKAAQ